VAFLRDGRPRREQAEGVAEAARDRVGREYRHAGRGQLERERHPVQLPADLRDRPGAFVIERPPAIDAAGAVDEQPGGVRAREAGDAVLHRQGQRGHQPPRLAGNRERHPAGRKHRQRRALAQQPREDPGDLLDQVLAVVDHEQRVAAVKVGDRGIQLADPRQRAHSETLDQRRRDGTGVGDARELDPPHAAGEGGSATRGRLDGEPGLAHASRSGQRQQPRRRQRGADGLQILLATDQRSELGRQAVRRHVGASSHGRRRASSPIRVARRRGGYRSAMGALRELTWERRKTVTEALATTEEHGFTLRRELTALDVTVLGVGVIIGAGIFVLTGNAAATEAGPAIVLSFVLAGLVCVFAALCYAELAAMVPVAGSAYTFTYATLGELVAFVIGWDLALEFIVGASAVAVGWSAYLNSTLDQIFGYTLPASISGPPSAEGGAVNVPAIAIVAIVAFLLVRGIRITAKANLLVTAAIVATLLIVIVVGGSEVDADNWSPFTPFGWDGIVGGAAVVFFAYIGFDIVATTAEETRNPQRDMPIGILASLAIVTLLYFLVAGVITGMRPYDELDSAAPIADAFELLDRPWAAAVVYAGALLALTNTVLILMLGQSRVGFAMARDRLFPKALGATHERYGTPARLTILIAVLVSVLAGFTGIDTLADLVNIGTLFAFILVSIGVVLLRRTDPERPRPFRTPFVPLVPILAVGLAIWLMLTLDWKTWVRFGGWMVVGFLVYGFYSRRRSTIGHERGQG
jgi:basic amino acid/polyamine antiporter, APA family